MWTWSGWMQALLQGSWQTWASLLCLHLLHRLAPLLRSLGAAIEWIPNFLQVNGFFRTIFFLAVFRWDLITWRPPKDSPTYFTLIGWMDTRLDLMNPTAEFKEPNTKTFLDLCIMASKLAYESPQVQKHVVEGHWNMCFQIFLDCWNDRVQCKTTQALIFTNKQKNAELVVVAFRGTEAFEVGDWSTNLDFTWFELSAEAGKVHLGFLEALGYRSDDQSTSFHHTNLEHTSSITQLNTNAQYKDKVLAFDAISKEVRRLLNENPHAKLFLTGHSLGGALAVLFAGVLMFNVNSHTDKDNILHKLSAIHTFGQPRVGDSVFATFMNKSMKALNIHYYRIVYCNDMVTRMPFDNHLFGFKHIGHVCYYYDSFFNVEVLNEEPNKNISSPLYFFRMMITAIWELLRSLVMPFRYGECFKETLLAIILRLFFGLVSPAGLAHMPTNYVSAVRLGPQKLKEYTYGDE